MLLLAKKHTNTLYIVFLMISIIYMLIQPDIVVNSIKETLSTFVLTVLPTLFPFILCSQMILMLNGAKIIGYPLIILTKLLNLDADTSGAYAASLIGGYPSGAASLSLLYSRGRLKSNYLVSMLLCSNCGPMFLIGTVGTLLLNSYSAGIVILVSHILGGIISAAIFSTIKTGKSDKHSQKKVSEKIVRETNIFQMLDRSILNTSKIMVKIFAFMGIFKIIGDAIFNNYQSLNSTTIPEVLFRGSLEVMDGCLSAVGLDFYLAATVICAIVSFGGLSVVFQSISVSKEIPYSKPMFILGKMCHGIISGLLCLTFIRFIPYSIDAYAQQKKEIINLQYPIPNIILLLIAGCAVYIIIRNLIWTNSKSV